MRHSFVLLAAFVCIALSFNACKKSGSGDNKPTEQPGKIPGMGANTGTPEGEQYVLPAGITIVGNIYGDNCDTTYRVGSGYLVEVCVGLFNNKTKDTIIALPAGLIILATNAAEDQHGVVIHETKVVLKAKKLTRVGVGAYCINSSKHSSSSDQTYKLGPVSSSQLMQQLIGWLKNKKINRNEYTDEDAYLETVGTVQSLVWAITDGEGTSDLARQIMLDKIPNK